MTPYDKHAFVKGILELSRKEMLERTQAEVELIHSLLYDKRGHQVRNSSRKRELGAAEYMDFLRKLVWFLTSAILPSVKSDQDMHLIRSVCEALVDGGEIPKEFLQKFSTTDGAEGKCDGG